MYGFTLYKDLASSSRLEPNVPPMEDTSNHQSKNNDDDLGFDPFHETQKALAEMLEKESISSLPNGSVYSNTNGCSNLGYSGPVQSLYSNPPVPPSMARHSPSFSPLGLGLGLGVGVAPQPQPSRTRIPPPGFNPSQVYKNTQHFYFNSSIFPKESVFIQSFLLLFSASCRVNEPRWSQSLWSEPSQYQFKSTSESLRHGYQQNVAVHEQSEHIKRGCEWSFDWIWTSDVSRVGFLGFRNVRDWRHEWHGIQHELHGRSKRFPKSYVGQQAAR